ncbi:DUF998 domain-containing protein [Spirilliplanes yamanashiensis]|uniref:DUF998 domain-containing protein n=1 Tax=Spirilliplanes yamanashiensis TaxID=42233 RepID=A0A8J3Y7K0_9ACTN|nr:DUF998 domain-containing protein [Spirilliplanes yamanashiensis]MDP9817460.1 hypothetical protein [Spirilliplanes yamanashiensis]GIJ02887.1 hypothetical protein Sya03_22390 [Spirilliplanes yamanashiensis]
MTTTRNLLRCGVAAGPLFLTATLAQAATRDGYDLAKHPVSLLALGAHGWLQVATFVVTGLLYTACAVGMRRALRGGPAGLWGPLLVGALGAGLVVSGVFVTDAGAGFPAGAPAGAPEVSWHGALHGLGAAVAFGGMSVGCLVLARRLWPVWSVATAAAALTLSFWPDPAGAPLRLLAASAVLFAYVATVALRLLRAGNRPRPAGPAPVGAERAATGG